MRPYLMPALGVVASAAIVGGLVFLLEPASRAPWVMHSWVSVGGGSIATTPTTERQCKAMIEVINNTNDPVVIRCLGPAGERAETEWWARRAERMPPTLFRQPLPKPVPAPATAHSGGI